MNVDNNILDQIRQYYADELTAADTRQLEELIDTDERYAFHDRLFRTIKQGIGEASPDKAAYFEEIRKAAEDGQANVIKSLKKNDRTGTGFRRLWLILPLFVVLSGIGYFIWTQASNSEKNLPVAPSPDKSIAEENREIEEGLLGTTGKTFSMEIPVLRFEETEGQLVETAKRQTLLLRQGRSEKNYYFYDGDTLVLLTGQYETMKMAAIALLQKDGQAYLRLESKVYQIEIGTEEPSLLEKEVELE